MTDDRLSAAMPWRLRVARALCRRLPPLAAQSLRQRIYPPPLAMRHDYPYRVVNRAGYTFTGRTSDPAAYPFAVHGYYDWRNVAIAMATCREGQTIIEVGAHIGTETVSFAAVVGRAGRVVAFEPFAPHVDALERTFAGEANVTIVPCAVSDAVGELRFVAPQGPQTSGSGHLLGADDPHSPGAVTVPCVTIDSLRDRWRDVTIAFIDAEGAELAILRGAIELIARDHPHLVLEASAHHAARSGSSLVTLHAQLAELGYTPFAITRFGLGRVDGASRRPTCNWLCVHAERKDDVKRAAAMLRRCGSMPLLSRLNPLGRVAGL